MDMTRLQDKDLLAMLVGQVMALKLSGRSLSELFGFVKLNCSLPPVSDDVVQEALHHI